MKRRYGGDDFDDISVKEESAVALCKLKRRKHQVPTNAIVMPGHGSISVDSYASLLNRASSSSASSVVNTTTTTTTAAIKVKKERVPKTIKSELDTRVERVNVTPFSYLEARPYELEAAKNLLSDMYLATVYIPDAQNSQLPRLSVRELLDQKLVVLPLIESHFADMLLHEAGRWPVMYYSGTNNIDGKWTGDETVKRDYPACDYGNKCVCMTMGFEALDGTIPSGFICTQLILPQEYTRLVDSNIQPPKRPCILCSRHKSGMFIPFIQSLARKKTMSSTCNGINSKPSVLDENEHFHLFREIKDAREGYIGKYMSIPRPGVWEGYVDPICKLNHELLIASRDGTSRRFIDQSLLKHKTLETLDIKIGEQLSNF